MSKYNRTLKSKYNKKGGDKKVSELEMNKCNNFCSTSYLDKYYKFFYKTTKNNPYTKSKPKTDNEIRKLFKNVNIDEKINECKKVFCNPNCKDLHKNKKMRYVCPICEKTFPTIKKLGAITYCKHDSII
jgi:hypothetical protein